MKDIVRLKNIAISRFWWRHRWTLGPKNI